MIYEARDKNNLNLNRRLMGQFRTALNQSKLIEISLQNRKFTWSNERANPTLCKLDRIFCNKDWDVLFSNVQLQALSSSMSDHYPLYLGPTKGPYRKVSFKFENFWTRVPGFCDVVQQAWNMPMTGHSALVILRQKLQNVAKALKNWSSFHFRALKP